MAPDLRHRLLALERRIYTRLRRFADARLATRALRAGRNPKPAHLLTGERGEDAAFFFLRERGWHITARRWRAPRGPGDLDLVAWEGTTLVVFEVKTRTRRDLFPAEAEVDRAKQRVLRRVARAFLRQYTESEREDLHVRFDVIAVYLLGNTATCEHFLNRFPLEEDRRRL
jgi:putative endonuclease